MFDQSYVYIFIPRTIIHLLFHSSTNKNVKHLIISHKLGQILKQINFQKVSIWGY